MRKFNVLMLIVLIYNVGWSQNNKEELSAYMMQADSLFLKKEFVIADSLYNLTEKGYRVKREWDNWYKAVTKIRLIAQNNHDYTKAVELLITFGEMIPENEISINAKLSYHKAYNLSKLLKIIEGNIEFKKSLSLFNLIHEKSEKDKFFIKIIYESLSINYSRLGDQESAIKYCDFAIEFCEINNLVDNLCYLYINKGQFFYHNKQYENAFEQYTHSLELCNSDETRFYIYVAIAQLLLQQNKKEEANIYLESAENLNIENHYDYLIVKASYLFEMGEYEQGSNVIKKAFELLKNNNDIKNLIKELTKYSMLLYDKGEKGEAISYAHQALCLFYLDLNENDYVDRPNDNKTLPYTYIIEALNIKAKYFRDKYIETKDEFSLNESTFYYNLLLSHFDKLKSKYYSSSSQYRMGAYTQKIYSEVISFFVDQYSQNDKKANLENAFSLAQRANSFVLRNAVSDRKALEMAGVNQDSLEQYLFLASKASSDNEEDSTGSGAKVLIEFDAYKESLLSNYPSYGKYDNEEEITIEEIQSTLDQNSLVIKYYYFNEMLTVFGITKNSIFAENISYPKEIDSLINSNLEILSQHESNYSLANMYLSNSKTVFDLVLGDLLKKYNLNSINHLIIVPDGPLKKVAFNALAINNSKDWNDPNTYLMSKYSVNYLYYCSQLKVDNKSYKSKDGFIGFGIEYEDEFLKQIIGDYMSSFKEGESNTRAISLSPLKYADDEVLATAEILDGIPFINLEVTPSHVLSTINNFDVVHFSAHAFVDEDDYLNSFIVLNKDDGEKYQLSYADILNLDIDSEMVVLSACQTSSGKSVVGEGLMSLSRAFVQSGSNAAVGAYWNAPDYATKELMTLFYSNLKDGMTKSKAMQQAQIEYLTNDKISSPTIRSPFFWASWAVYGDDQPLHMSASLFSFTSWKSYLLIAGIGFLIFFLAKLFFRNSKD